MNDDDEMNLPQDLSDDALESEEKELVSKIRATVIDADQQKAAAIRNSLRT